MSPSARSAANGGAAPRGRVPPCTLAPASAAISARSSASPSTCASGSPSPPTAATSMHEWPSPSPQPRTSSSRRPHHRARAIELHALVPRSPPEHRDDGSVGPHHKGIPQWSITPPHPPTPPSAARQSRCRKAGSTGSWCCPFVMRSTCSAAQLTGAIRDALGKAPAGLIVDLSVLLTSVSLADFELDSLILVKRAKTARLDLGMVHEYIFCTGHPER